jgi:hypothetical protein
MNVSRCGGLRQGALQLREARGLCEVEIEARLVCLVDVIRQSMTTQGYEHALLQRRRAPNGSRNFVAAHSRQTDVAEDDVREASLRQLEPLDSRTRREGLVPVEFKEVPQRQRCVGIVFDHQDSPFHDAVILHLVLAMANSTISQLAQGTWAPGELGCGLQPADISPQ